MITASINLITTATEIEENINKIISNQINNSVKISIPDIRLRVQLIVEKSIENSPEYQSLVNGRLHDEFGLVTPLDALKDIISSIISGLEIVYTEMKSNANGLLSIEILKSDFSDILKSESLAGSPIPWLTWLLTAGDNIVVAQYSVTYQPGSTSRTGTAIMVKSGEGYRVPPEFSGTIDNNWLIRSILILEPEFARIAEEEISKRI